MLNNSKINKKRDLVLAKLVRITFTENLITEESSKMNRNCKETVANNQKMTADILRIHFK